MSLETDALVDRRRLKRRLAFWRVLAVLALVVAAVVAVRPGGRFRPVSLVRHIERVRIEGLIGNGRNTIEALDKARRDASVAAVILHLDTPGGEVAGGEGIHQAVQDLAAAKPIVAVMDGTAASAGYMIAVASPHIVARESTLTGSIGVILETANFGALLDKLGVQVDPLVSGPLKGQPSGTRPLSPEGRIYLQALVGDLFDQFVTIVATGRHMEPSAVRKLADGRAYTGRQAKALGLVDEIGGELEATRWLEQVRHLPADLPVTETDHRSFMTKMIASSIADLVISSEQALRVDGAWSVWQPSVPRD